MNLLQFLGVAGRIFPEKEKTQLLSTNSRRQRSLSLGMKQVCSRKFSIPSWFICFMNLLFMTSRATHNSLEKSLLQKGPKFAITPSSMPKHIRDSLGENILFSKTDCMEYYAKVKDVLTKFTNIPKPIVSNITKEESKSLNNLKKDDSCMVLSTDKGVALIVIDKDMYIEKCMALLSAQEVYQDCKDQTKSIHAKVLKQPLELFKTFHWTKIQGTIHQTLSSW